MKKFILLTSFVILSFIAQSQIKSVKLQASGLTCSMCSNAIFKSLKTLDFISEVKSDIQNSSFVIGFVPNGKIDFDAIEKKVSAAGFSVADFKVTLIFNNLAVKNDAHVKIGNDYFHFINVPNQVLQGEKTVQIIDKKFLSSKQFAKYNGYTKMECHKTGTMEGIGRIFHVTI